MGNEKLVPEIRFNEFKNHWKKVKLKDILEVNYGKDYKELAKGSVPVYGTGGIISYVNRILSRTNSVGLGRKGTINVPQLLKHPFWTVDTLFFWSQKNMLIYSFYIC